MKPVILILIVTAIGCSQSTTPPKRIDCPAPTIGNDGSVSNWPCN